MFLMVFFVVIFFQLSFVLSQYYSDIYPTDIPNYEIRRDVYTNKTVTSGLLHSLAFKSTLSNFKKYLQCSPNEPNLNYNSGIISMLRMSPPTYESFQVMCAYIETDRYSWKESREYVINAKKGKYRKDDKFNYLNAYSKAYLIRIIKGNVFYDWPWGIQRFTDKQNTNTILPLIKMTLSRIIDMKDSVFFVAGDQPSIHYDVPLPIFSHSTAETYSDIVWPWYEMWQDANQMYKSMRKASYEFIESNYKKIEKGYRPWKRRVAKSAYFGALFRNRQFMFDIARLHPDLFDARLTTQWGLEPWNPSSTEIDGKNLTISNKPVAGYVSSIANISAGDKFVKYFPGAYKYVIVPLGYGSGLSTSSRLQHLLSYSGAVILMQRSAYKFHISAQLQPWVHYVPISFSGSDVLEKVQWLKNHDRLAQRIAENGRNFARSYLRLEDYYCYAASALDAMSEIGKLSPDLIKKTFNAKKLQPFEVRFEDTEALIWPK